MNDEFTNYQAQYVQTLRDHMEIASDERKRLMARVQVLNQKLEKFEAAIEVHSVVATSEYTQHEETESVTGGPSQSISSRIEAVLEDQPQGLDTAGISYELERHSPVKSASLMSILSRMAKSGLVEKNGRLFSLPRHQLEARFAPDDLPNFDELRSISIAQYRRD